MNELEMVCFQIISNVGLARSTYIEAIHKARDNDFEGARESIKKGQESFLAGHDAHLKLLQLEAKGELNSGSVMLIHAEDQLMSAEGFKIIAEEMISCYEKMEDLIKAKN